jgi:hypothetical protein
MAELWSRQFIQPQLFVDMGHYFTRFAPPRDGRDCYSRLVIALKARGLLSRVGIATLNYECVLDLAVLQQGLDVNYLTEGWEPRPGGLLVLKPHGACNLLPDVDISGDANTRMDAGVLSELYEGGIKALSLDAAHERYNNRFGLPPVMSMYMRDKRSPVAKSYIDEIRAMWGYWVQECSAVLCVGARPVLWDEHIWLPIMARKTTTWFVGGHDGDYSAFAAALGPKLDYVGREFDGAMAEILTRFDRFQSA